MSTEKNQKERKNSRAVKIIKEFSERIMGDHVGAYAAQSAFFILLSFIPFMMLLLNIIQYTPLTEEAVSSAVMSIIPEDFHGVVKTIIMEIYRRSSAILPVSAIIALWSAGKAITSLTYGLNTVYHVKETRNYFVNRLRSMLFTLFFIGAFLVTLVLMVFGRSIQQALTEYFPAVAEFTGMLLSLRTVITMAALMFTFVLMYRFVPNRKVSFESQIPGALVTTISWQILSVGFSFYLEYFPGVTRMYGNLTTMILLMLWVYFCMYLVLVGAEINDWFERRMTGQEQNLLDSKKECG
ncbi:MAG TPA: YihY/virulence factor BrkB family protein [Candidatus Scatomonas merdigallinarum]|nr:YihY/virulence factor BrkB family protein [Candidatus Scatomonas merdigallinarum]